MPISQKCISIVSQHTVAEKRAVLAFIRRISLSIVVLKKVLKVFLRLPYLN
jgi:hypothetical protein